MADAKKHRHAGIKGELIKLLGQLPCYGPDPQQGGCPLRRHGMCREVDKLDYCAVQALADHLIANGVTVQQWIPVTERLPEKTDGHVLVTDGDVVKISCRNAMYKTRGGETWCAQNYGAGMCVTHWIPLPQPPKGDSDG